MSDTPVVELVPDQSELFIGVVAAVGTDVEMVCDKIATELDGYKYASTIVRLSTFLEELTGHSFKGRPFDEEVWEAMTAGNLLREAWSRNDALALQAISQIVVTRAEQASSVVPGGAGEEPQPGHLERHAFVLRSLKTPAELNTLRAIYGPRLIVVAAYSPRDRRLAHLAEQIERSRKTSNQTAWAHSPEDLVARDEREEAKGRTHAAGQNVSDTFHRADFFVRAWDPAVLGDDLARAFEVLFGSPYRTPTRDEQGQFLTAGAARRSAELGRQVGAAITTEDGSVISIGCNEVPAKGGGQPWEEDGPGNRDFEIGDMDTNRKHLDELAQELAKTVEGRLEGLIEQIGDRSEDVELLRARLAETLPGDLRSGGLKDLTEFGRAVHAEMAALLDAARRGVPVAGATLYTTTFPCHNCARHIIVAGISRVVFIEPYPKSRTEQLHGDAVTVDASLSDDGRIAFRPFVGVAPRRYLEMFDAAGRERLGHTRRRDDAGRKQDFVKATATPVFVDSGLAEFRPRLHAYRAKELLALNYFDAYSSDGQPDPSGPS